MIFFRWLCVFSFVFVSVVSASTMNGLYFTGGVGYGMQAPFSDFEHASFSSPELINSGIAASIGMGYKFSYFFETELDLLKGEDVTVGTSNDTVINNNYAAVASVQAVLPLTQKINFDAGIGAKFNYFQSKDGFTLKQGDQHYTVKPGDQVGQIAPEVMLGVSTRVVDSLRVMAISRYDLQYKKSPESYSFQLALRWLV